MRRTLLLCTAALLVASTLSAQTPGPARAATKPAAIIIQVTDSLGAPLADAAVTASGPVAREGVSGADGSIRFANLRAGTYRLKFVREGSITLERDVTLRAGESLSVDAALTAAPVANPVAPPSPAIVAAPNTNAMAAPNLGPPGEPKVTPVPLFLEKNFIGGRQPRKESSLGCTPTGMATLHQLRDAWLSHTHDTADEWIYVVAGEGAMRIGGNEHKVQAGTFTLVPYTVAHALIPQGRNPLILISILSGPPCK